MKFRVLVVEDSGKLIFLSQGVLFEKIHSAWFDNYGFGRGTITLIRQDKKTDAGRIDYVGTHIEVSIFLLLPAFRSDDDSISAVKFEERDVLEFDFPKSLKETEFWFSVANEIKRH